MKRNNLKKWLLPALLLPSAALLAQTRELSLQEALKLASQKNRQLKIKVLGNEKALQATKEASSYMLPTVSAGGSYTIYGERPVIYLRNEAASPKVDDVKFGGRFALDGNINASYALLNPVNTSNVRSAEIIEQISKQEIKITEENLALQIGQLYLRALMNKEQQMLLKHSLQRNESALNDSRSLFLQGKSLKTDTLSNYISVQNLKASLSALKNNLTVISEQLKQLSGLESDSAELVFTDSLQLPTQDISNPEAGLTVALENRSDLQIQSLFIAQSKEQLQKTKAEFKPQLTAFAQYQLQNQSDNLNFWSGGIPRTSFAGVRLNIPIYSGNRLKYKAIQSELSIRQNELALNELKTSVQTELVSLHASLRDAYDQWHIQQQNVDAAQINYNMVNDRYRYGLSNRLELTDAELALTKSRLDYLQAVYSINLLQLHLKKALGTLDLQ